MSEERAPALPIAARMRNGFRRLLDASFRYEAAWGLLGAIGLTLLLSFPPWGVSYGELTPGQPAPRDIIVPLEVVVPDEAGTEAMREAARRQVPPSYVFDSDAALRADRAIAEAFESARSLLEGEQDRSGGMSPEALRGAILSVLPPGLPSAFAEVCLHARFEPALERDLRFAARSLLSAMIVSTRDVLPQEGPISVRWLQEERERQVSDTSQILDVEAARGQARELAAGIGRVPEPERPVLASLLQRLVEPTLKPDHQATARRADEAALSVPARFARLERGAVLARRGALVTRELVEQARAVEKARPASVGLLPALGNALLASLLVAFLWRYPRYQRRRGPSPRHLFSMLVLLLLVMLAVTRGLLAVASLLVERAEPPFDRIEAMLYVIPVAAGGMLAALLFSGRVAMIYSLFFSVPYAVMAGWDLGLFGYSLITHFAAVYAASQYRARTAVAKAGFVVGATGAVAAIALDLARGPAASWQVLAADAGAALAGGAVGVTLLVSGGMPFLESLFGVLTDVRLLELSNLNTPLLSQLAATAPGSYNHSLVVGTLAEAAADAIGANGLFCRVAAFYHDIGKIRMPEYYVENQRGGENPHDRLAPSMSSLVLASHVKEGMRLAREHGLPQQVVDIIPQHHGTRVMTYFFEKSKAAAGEGGTPPVVDAFRYPGPRPQSREAAIFMLADATEAAARTIDEPNAERFRGMIRQIAGRIVLDGQFDECDLTFKDLDVIVESFVRSLLAIYHHRVDYPTYVFEDDRRDKDEAPQKKGAVT